MHIHDDDLQARAEAGIDVAADRRRAGRKTVNPQLLPLLRGEFDHEAPVGPEAGKRGQFALDQKLVSGAIIALALLLVGAVLRFVA